MEEWQANERLETVLLIRLFHNTKPSDVPLKEDKSLCRPTRRDVAKVFQYSKSCNVCNSLKKYVTINPMGDGLINSSA